MNAQPHAGGQLALPPHNLLRDAERDMEDFEAVLDLPHPPEDRSDKAALDAYLSSLLARIGKIDAQKVHNERVAELLIRPHIEWRDAEARKLDVRREYLVETLRSLTVQYEYEDGKRSRTLASGKFGLNHRGATVKVQDPDKAVAWSKANGLPVNVSEKPVHKELAAHFKRTGEVPEGTELVEESESFYVTPIVEE